MDRRELESKYSVYLQRNLMSGDWLLLSIMQDGTMQSVTPESLGTTLTEVEHKLESRKRCDRERMLGNEYEQDFWCNLLV